jgi:glycosyltransferase involved in cell wall biosynthesis
MRIIIDMQGAQSSGSRNRGIGRYTLSLSKAIVRNRGKHEVILALNGLFPETIESIRADFEDLLPQENIRVWYAPGSVGNLNVENDWRRKAAELLREAFIASLNPDVVLITSLFEGLDDDVVTSIGLLSSNVPTAVILYDLIPFIHRQPYLENSAVEAWYENKLNHLRRGNLILAISESSRQEGISYLGFPEDILVNISTAADPHFQPQSISSQREREVRKHYCLEKPYVMYTGGIDHRKNIEGLIRAYASLPKTLRAQHQLAVVCNRTDLDYNRLMELANQHGLKKGELVLTGFVPEDDLLVLYGLCKLFVFPSWHEGFGLPALEAMSCGRAVIGSNCSSVPEVIGLEDALFDPKSDEAIAVLLTQTLTDPAFRVELERHGLEQAKKFSWDKSATRAITAFEQLHTEHQRRNAIEFTPARRPKLAFISPLPPERSGISYYSAKLLPELSRHYDIDVIVAQDSVSDPWVNANCQIRNVEWFRSHASSYERVLYHFGNSHFHQHMFSLLEEIPGVVVLHDFFLSGIVAHMDIHGMKPNGWANELYKAHGYNAVQERFHATDMADVIWKYPCNLSILNRAKGVIVHSENSRKLVKQWYTTNVSTEWDVIPLLRVPIVEPDRIKARQFLNIEPEDFVVCCFGLLSSTKLNHRLLNAWLASKLSKDKSCVLVFVGENDGEGYGSKLLSAIKKSKSNNQVSITGWASNETYCDYLTAADIGVQLRTNSRGETSAAVLDCMNYGLPTIVNANGSMADLDDDAVLKVPDEFTDDQLISALEKLWEDGNARKQIGSRAREIILSKHAPRTCVDKYFYAIENNYVNAESDIHSLLNAVAKIEQVPDTQEAFISLAKSIAHSIHPRFTPKQLLVDISKLLQNDDKDDLNAKNKLQELLNNPPPGLKVEPVYATTKKQGYLYARNFTMGFLDCPVDIFNDEMVEIRSGDIFLQLAQTPEIVEAQQDFYQKLRNDGIEVK